MAPERPVPAIGSAASSCGTTCLQARIVETSPAAIVVHDPTGRIVDCSAEAARALGTTRRALIGLAAGDERWEPVDVDGRPIAAGDMPAGLAIRTGEAQRGAILGVRAPDGRRRWLLVDTDVFADAHGHPYAVSCFMDITRRRRLEAWQALTLSLLEEMAGRASLDALLLRLVGFVEAQLSGARCSVHLLSEDRRRLRKGLSPSLPKPYLEALEGLEISPTVGSCGAAASLGMTIIVPDVYAHPNWAAYHDLPTAFGFRACWSEPVLDEDRRPTGTFAVYYDDVRSPEEDDLLLLRQSASLAAFVIQRANAREDLLLAAALFDQGTESVVVTDPQHRIVRVNRAFERLTGYMASEVEGRHPAHLQASLPTALTGKGIDEALADDGRWQGEMLVRCRSGEAVPVWLSVVALYDRNGDVSHYLRTAVDLRDTKAQAERIRQLAFFDPLTRLPNRALVVDRLRQAISSAERRGRPLAVLFIDLNRFKEVNDTLGHDAGDQVLAAIAERFSTSMRAEDTIGRLGGDEFIVVADGAGEAEATLCAERLIASLADPIVVNGQPFSLGASVGIAMHPGDGRTPDELMKHADIAMYRAKAGGGGVRLYRPEMSSGLGERVALAHDLKSALANGELALHFQPQFELATGRLSGAEALLRWTHPRLGAISPTVFIPLAEERSMMVPLGAWVLDAACAQLARWQSEGRELPGRLAINVSAQQLEEPDVQERTLRILDAHAVSPSSLELELTESMLMRNVDHAMAVLRQLKDAGFALAIDDFGTGYSSLAHLKRFPVTRLKVDMGFVRDMLVDRSDYAIVGSIVGMAAPLRLCTVAEGVESEAQAEALRQLGCQHAQGYLFGRPVPATEFARRWLPIDGASPA